MKIISALNSIWKNLLFVFLIGLLLVSLIAYNLFVRKGEHLDFTVTDILAIISYWVLCLHVLVLFLLVIVNIIQRTFLKSLLFFATCVALCLGLYVIAPFLAISTIGGPPVDEGNRNNFKPSELCKQFDIALIRTTVENRSSGIYDNQFGSNFIEQIKQDSSMLPEKILKISCGCRILDTNIVVFRLLDNQQQTFELEMIREGEQWKYNMLTMENF